MYDSSHNENSVRVFVGPFCSCDPSMLNAWIVSNDLGTPRILPAVSLAAGVFAGIVRPWFQRSGARSDVPAEVSATHDAAVEGPGSAPASPPQDHAPGKGKARTPDAA